MAYRSSSPASTIGRGSGRRYGTLICDLERHRIVDPSFDREPATLDAWLVRHPKVAIVARNRGDGYGYGYGYGQAVTRVRPEVLRVADRW